MSFLTPFMSRSVNLLKPDMVFVMRRRSFHRDEIAQLGAKDPEPTDSTRRLAVLSLGVLEVQPLLGQQHAQAIEFLLLLNVCRFLRGPSFLLAPRPLLRRLLFSVRLGLRGAAPAGGFVHTSLLAVCIADVAPIIPPVNLSPLLIFNVCHPAVPYQPTARSWPPVAAARACS